MCTLLVLLLAIWSGVSGIAFTQSHQQVVGLSDARICLGPHAVGLPGVCTVLALQPILHTSVANLSRLPVSVLKVQPPPHDDRACRCLACSRCPTRTFAIPLQLIAAPCHAASIACSHLPPNRTVSHWSDSRQTAGPRRLNCQQKTTHRRYTCVSRRDHGDPAQTHPLHMVLRSVWTLRSVSFSHAQNILQWLPLHVALPRTLLRIPVYYIGHMVLFVILALASSIGPHPPTQTYCATKRPHLPSAQGMFLHRWRLAQTRLRGFKRRRHLRNRSWLQAMHRIVRSRIHQYSRYGWTLVCWLAYPCTLIISAVTLPEYYIVHWTLALLSHVVSLLNYAHPRKVGGAANETICTTSPPTLHQKYTGNHKY